MFISNWKWCTRWRRWLRHCTKSRKVAGFIPDGVIGIFYLQDSSGRSMALGLIQPLTEISTRNVSWGVKAAGAWGWQPYHLHVPIVLKSGSLSLLEPLWSAQACNGYALIFYHLKIKRHSPTLFLYMSNLSELPWDFWRGDILQSNVPLCDLFQVKLRLNICCEFWLNQT
jgi:hypothetical protein